MIDPVQPDYSNTPACDNRPVYHYAPRDYGTPVVTIITPYYNTGPVFWETVRSIQRMSFAHWEWLIVDDGSTDPASLAQLQRLQAMEPRARVIRQPNAGPAAARNRAIAEARGTYIFQIDSDDLIEPTLVEKAVWVLATRLEFAACNGYNVTFGNVNYLWPTGFQAYEASLEDNKITNQTVIRRDAILQVGGYDENLRRGHEDWDFWLSLADVGMWGYTIPEFLTWYRRQEQSRIAETESDQARARAFRVWLRQKHSTLVEHFPHPRWIPSVEIPQPLIRDDLWVTNPLRKPEGVRRVLLVVPWLEVGGADKFNLDLIRLLSERDYEFTVVTMRQSENPWQHMFTALTPDVFCLHRFLKYGDYPVFLDYLIESRQIDAVVMSNSELGYTLAPYLRARHPQVAILDYNHSVVENWKNGGYPGMALRITGQLDLHVANTQHLKQWMLAHDGDSDRIQVCHCGIDTSEWCKDHYDTEAVRKRFGLAPDTPIILFVGRFSFEKRPLLFAQIIARLARVERNFVALMVGDGSELPAVRDFLRRAHLEERLRLLGALPNRSVRELMAVGDILVVCSEIEGLALVLYESMAMETIPVAVDIAGHPELVTAECGYLVPRSEDELDVYVRTLAAILHDPDRRSMATRARQRVASHFDLANMADGMDAAITKAMRLSATRPAEPANLELIRHATHLALENTRLEELADFLWAERAKTPVGGFLRRTRQRILPIGSRRYEAYKRLRQGVRRMRHGLKRLLRGSGAGGPSGDKGLRHLEPPGVAVSAPLETLAEVREEAPALVEPHQQPV